MAYNLVQHITLVKRPLLLDSTESELARSLATTTFNRSPVLRCISHLSRKRMWLLPWPEAKPFRSIQNASLLLNFVAIFELSLQKYIETILVVIQLNYSSRKFALKFVKNYLTVLI